MFWILDLHLKSTPPLPPPASHCDGYPKNAYRIYSIISAVSSRSAVSNWSALKRENEIYKCPLYLKCPLFLKCPQKINWFGLWLHDINASAYYFFHKFWSLSLSSDMHSTRTQHNMTRTQRNAYLFFGMYLLSE